MNYLDFEVEIGEGTGREYPVAVIRSPAGEARETMRFPFDELQLESRLKDLEIALLRAGGKRRLILSQEERTVQNLGQEFFKALLTGEVLSRYRVSLERAAGQGAGLRLKLRIAPPELAALPWEFLYDANRSEYVCLSNKTPIVRYLELPHVIPPMTVTPPLRILAMVANPSDLPELDIEREKQRMMLALAGLQQAGLVDLTWLAGQTWQDLQRVLRHGPWHVFHFIGHGGFNPSKGEGEIALVDERGRSQRFAATRLGRLLADESLRLVVLNACEGARGSEQDVFSSTAAILVQRGLPAVLAMQYEISDRAAIEFARSFYEAIADAYPVDAAVAEARKAISFAVENSLEWGTPVLYMRSADGLLFSLQSRPLVVVAKPTPTAEQAQVKPVTVAPVPSVDPAYLAWLQQQMLPPVLIPLGKSAAESTHAPSPTYLAWLRQQIAQVFSLEELRSLCFDLRVDYENLPGEGKAAKSRELVIHLERQGRVSDLVTTCLRLRPNIHWRERAIRGGTVGDLNRYGEPEWVEIPAGEFWMGSETGRDYEKPLHRLYLDTFWIARTPVTNAQYRLFVAASGHRLPRHWQEGGIPAGLEHHPVVYIHWDDTLMYCRWLSQVTGKAITLPSEAEWEKAARGHEDQREYPWGNTFEIGRANTKEAGINTTSPTGSYPSGASLYGLLDMSGNVFEWTRSSWDSSWNQPDSGYPYIAEEGRENLDGRELRILRGGSWHNDKTWAGCSARLRYYPAVGFNDRYGFRVAISPYASGL